MAEYRPLFPEDLTKITLAEKDLFSDPWSENSLKDHLISPHCGGAVAKENGVLCGYALTTLVAGEGEILRIGILPPFRRRGMGSKLLSFCLEKGKKEGAKAFFLEVREGNLAARNLYEKIGFLQSGVRKDYYASPKENAVLYQITLKNEE